MKVTQQKKIQLQAARIHMIFLANWCSARCVFTCNKAISYIGIFLQEQIKYRLITFKVFKVCVSNKRFQFFPLLSKGNAIIMDLTN